MKDVITLFHAPKNPVSTRVYTLLKQANATAVAHATEDQASDHSKQSKLERTEFELGMHPTPKRAMGNGDNEMRKGGSNMLIIHVKRFKRALPPKIRSTAFWNISDHRTQAA